MKRPRFIFIVIMLFAFSVNVYAAEYKIGDIIPVTESAVIKTENFDYNNMMIAAATNGDKYDKIVFESITNKTNSKLPVSINVLLFNNDLKNIGFVTYCSNSDYDSDYSQFTLKPKEGSVFNIILLDKYYVEGKSFKDIAYYVVLDDNIYCHIGGYSKYAGKTIEQIKAINDGSDVVQEKKAIFANTDITSILYKLGIALAIYIVSGIILNALYKRIYADITILAYLPVGNNYVATKLAFGDMVAKYYLIAFLISIPLSLVGIGKIFIYILSFASSIAFIIDVVKLITKKYDLLIISPDFSKKLDSLRNMNEDDDDDDDNVASDLDEDDISGDNRERVNFLSGSEDEVVDLNYSSSNPTGTLPTELQGNSSDTSFDLSNNYTNDANVAGTSSPLDNNDNANNNDGESDLANFFR